jgi:hypothetical protein
MHGFQLQLGSYSQPYSFYYAEPLSSSQQQVVQTFSMLLKSATLVFPTLTFQTSTPVSESRYKLGTTSISWLP